MRSHNDWAALRKAEREGREEPGTFARLWAEEQALISAEKQRKMDEALASVKSIHAEIAKPKRKWL